MRSKPKSRLRVGTDDVSKKLMSFETIVGAPRYFAVSAALYLFLKKEKKEIGEEEIKYSHRGHNTSFEDLP